MSEKKPKIRRGRPNTPIDKGQLETMIAYGATCLDCANEFDCHTDTIENFIKANWSMNFSQFSDKKKGYFRTRLRQKMINLALDGNPTMLIWCSKNILGWADKTETKVERVESFTEFVKREQAEIRKLHDVKKKSDKKAS